MSYYGYVVKIDKLRPHSNADRLQVATFFGNDTCVGLDAKIDDLGIYFPSDGQLSEEFCEANNLVRKKDEAGNNIGGYLDPGKRNVTAIKLRGEKSDGMYLPIKCLESFGDISTLSPGDRIDTFNNHLICQKYIPRRNVRSNHSSAGNKTRKVKVNVAPLFREHADTEQLQYNLAAFQPGDEIEITLKLHGSSQRTAHIPVLTGHKRTLIDCILRREGKPIYELGYISGTRRTVLSDYEGGFYGSNAFREQHSKFFEGKLWAGETVYYEVVGFTDTGAPIMSDCDNKKTGDKEFIKQYGPTTTFSYGCAPNGMKSMYGVDDDGQFRIDSVVPQSAIYVYRMTMTNDDGDIVEYPPHFMRYRCEQMGANTVPLLWKGIIPDNPGTEEDPTVSPGEWIMKVAERYYDGPDPIGKGKHVREGVVVRITNKPKFCAYKFKNFYFKCLENIIKADALEPDMEEANDLILEDNNKEINENEA